MLINMKGFIKMAVQCNSSVGRNLGYVWWFDRAD